MGAQDLRFFFELHNLWNLKIFFLTVSATIFNLFNFLYLLRRNSIKNFSHHFRKKTELLCSRFETKQSKSLSIEPGNIFLKVDSLWLLISLHLIQKNIKPKEITHQLLSLVCKRFVKKNLVELVKQVNARNKKGGHRKVWVIEAILFDFIIIMTRNIQCHTWFISWDMSLLTELLEIILSSSAVVKDVSQFGWICENISFNH